MPYYAEIRPEEETTVLYRVMTDFEPGDVGFVVDAEVHFLVGRLVACSTSSSTFKEKPIPSQAL